MPTKSSIAALAIIVPVIAATPAQARPKPKLRLGAVSAPPSTLVAGGSFQSSVTVRNAGKRRGSGTIRQTLLGPSKLRFNRLRTKAIKPKHFITVTFQLNVPITATPGDYRLRTCLRRTGGHKSACKVSDTITITAPGDYTLPSS